MTTLLPRLLCVLALAAPLTGCRKEKPAPAAPTTSGALVGTWIEEYLTYSTRDSTGTVTVSGVSTGNNRLLVLTADRYTEKNSLDGRVYVDGPYTRTGNTVVIEATTAGQTYTLTETITELTATRLVWFREGPVGGGAVGRVEGVYTR